MYETIIQPTELATHLERADWAVIDCRFRLADPEAGHALYVDGHIPGAVYADLDRDLSGPPGGERGRHPLPALDDFRRTLSGWGITEGVQVVVYDDAGGGIAGRLWWMLRYLGHSAVALLDGGWPAWVAAALPTRRGVERRPVRPFLGQPDPSRLASLDEVVALVERGEGARLVDARAAERYRGEQEPLDPRAGHIPGARNRPFRDNLDRDGRMKPVAALQAEWEALLEADDAGEAIAYCGSGVSACLNILAMRHAGLPAARLFVPSWSGWSADERRPGESGAGDAADPLTPLEADD